MGHPHPALIITSLFLFLFLSFNLRGFIVFIVFQKVRLTASLLHPPDPFSLQTYPWTNTSSVSLVHAPYNRLTLNQTACNGHLVEVSHRTFASSPIWLQLKGTT